MPNGWESLVSELMNKYDAKSNSHKVKNICKFAAIYGLDGVQYAAYPQDFKLQQYQFELEQEDGSKTNVQVDEFKCAIEASKGNRSGGGAAGIRMNKTKFIMLRPSPEVEKGAYLSRQGGGGATVAQTAKCLIIGIWDKDVMMSNKQMQNTFDCTDAVEKMAKFLKKSGF